MVWMIYATKCAPKGPGCRASIRVAIVLLAAVACSGSSGPPRLVLLEEAHRTLDAGSRVRGAVLEADSFIVWTSGHVLAGAFDAGRIDTICRDTSLRPISVARSSRTEIQIVEPHSIVHARPGRCQRTQLRLAAVDSVAEAVLNGERWIGLVRSLLPPSRATVVPDSVEPPYIPRYRWSIVALLPDSGGVSPERDIVVPDGPLDESLHLTSADGYAIISRSRWPYNWARVTGGHGYPIVLSDSQGTGYSARLMSDQLRWLGLPVFALDSGYIRIHADMKGPTREFLLIPAPPRAQHRVIEVPVPFGILSVDRGARRLLALRRTSGPELVRYSWAWHDRD